MSYTLRSRWRCLRMEWREGREAWASDQLPEPGQEFLRFGLRQWLAVWIEDGCRYGLRVVRYRLFAWTLLPGDQVHDYRRMLDGVVVRIPRPGQAEVVWATAENLRRWPNCLEGASAVQDFHPWASGWHVSGRPVLWRESLPAVRLAPGWRYSLP